MCLTGDAGGSRGTRASRRGASTGGLRNISISDAVGVFVFIVVACLSVCVVVGGG